MLPVPDPAAAQLEFTIWDEEDKEVSWFGVHVLTLREGRGRRKLTDRMFHRAQAQGYSNFLGEVLLNLARLAPYKGHYIEQLFYIKQGKTIVTEEQASGNLKLGLRLDIPDSFAPQASPPVASPPVAEADSRAQEEKRRQAEEEQKKQEELRRLAEEQAAAAAAAEQRRKQEEDRRQAEQQAAAAAEAQKKAQEQQAAAAAEAQRKAQEQQAAAEAQRRHQEEMSRRQAEEHAAAEAQRRAHEEQMRQQEIARMQAQEQEMAKNAAQRASPPPNQPTSPTSQPAAAQPSSPERAQARIVSCTHMYAENDRSTAPNVLLQMKDDVLIRIALAGYCSD